MTQFEEKLLKYLVANKIIGKKEADNLTSNMSGSGMSFEEYLLRKTKIDEEKLLQAKAKVAEVSTWQFDKSPPVQKEILDLIPREAAEQYKMVPLRKEDESLVVGMVDPTDIRSQKALRFILLRTNLKPSITTLTERDLNKVLALYQEMKREVKTALEEMEKTLQEEAATAPKTGETAELKETPVTKIVAVILKHAIEGSASDIHIEPGRSKTNVRFRVDGVLYPSLSLPISVHSSIAARIKILSSLRLDESRIPQDGRFSTKLGGKLIDFRVSTFPTNQGEKIVMRVLDPASLVLDFDQLGLVGPNKDKVKNAINEPFGIILVSGPTGSGKTTTLYTALNDVDKNTLNVVSLEDPIEYYMDGVSQSQIRPEIDYTFASGLRHILRQDPDVMMVGEIRDSETAKLTIQASLTGHLVFSTVHTNNAVGVIPRLIDLDVDNFLLPSSLSLTMAQRLVGRLCGYCKKELDPHPNVLAMIENELSTLPKDILKHFDIKKPYKLWDSEGCPKCNNKRTKGRIAIFEVIEMTSELKRIILEEEANALAIEKEARKQGMISMKQDGIIKALQGTVSLQDVLRIVEEQI